MNVVVRNALSLISSQIATLVVTLVILVVVPRHLGDADFGRYAFSVTYVGMFGLVGLFGTGTFLLKTTARDPSLVGTYVFNALALKSVVALVLGATALTAGTIVGFDAQMMALVVAACITMAGNLMNDALVGGLYGLQRMSRPAFWSVVQAYVAGGLGVAAVLMGAGVAGYAFAILPAVAIPVVANSRALRGEMAGARRIDPAIWRAILAGGFPFLVVSAIQVVYGSIDMIMLRPLAGDATVGWYALAYRWVALPVLLASTALYALFPALSVHGAKVNEQFARLANRALMFVCLIGFPAAAGIGLVADDVIALIYRGGFSESVPLMQILGLSIPIVVIDMVLGMVMMAADRQRIWMMIGLAAAVLNPALNLFAISWTHDRYGNGAIGAALATVVTEALMLAGAVRFRPHGVLDRATTGYVVRCVAATLAMSAVVLALDGLPLAGEIGVGVVAYAVAATAIRIVSRSELAWFSSHLRPRSVAPAEQLVAAGASDTSRQTPTSSIVE